jgi:GNAT superfamily N-acetyltransferase
MTLEIRLAAKCDVPEVVRIKQSVWPGEVSNPDYITAVLERSDHETLVAVLDGRVAGFVDSFLTVSASRQPRWEVDLLAVHPSYQGRGLAARLVSASTAAGRRLGASVARGLVGIHNSASQRTFARCGYSTDCEVYHLYVSTSGSNRNPEFMGHVHAIQVLTLNYCGLWLEGYLTEAACAAAEGIRIREQRDVVGAVLSAANQAQIQVARNMGFVCVGDYQWWQLDLHEAGYTE